MGVILRWGNERTIVGEVNDPWTWDDLFEGWKTTVHMMGEKPYKVHTIVIAKSTHFPQGNLLPNLNRLIRVVPENLGLAIIVTQDRFHQLINAVFFKMTPPLRDRGHVVNTLEEAYALIDGWEDQHKQRLGC